MCYHTCYYTHFAHPTEFRVFFCKSIVHITKSNEQKKFCSDTKIKFSEKSRLFGAQVKDPEISLEIFQEAQPGPTYTTGTQTA